MSLKATVRKEKDGTKTLVIEATMHEPKPSKSGNTLMVAGTYGNVKTEAQVDGKEVTLNLNAWIKP